MGINVNELDAIVSLYEDGLLPHPGNIADMGAQQLHMTGQPVDRIRAFLRTFSPGQDFSDRKLAKLADNGYVGELLQYTDFHYCSFDLVSTPYNREFDFNTDAIDSEDKARYDLVTNFGTTEHVMDQVRSFRTIHDLTKVGGIMFHVLPINIEHGLLSYTTKFANLLVKANDYEVIEINYNQDPNFTPIQGDVMGRSYKYRSGPPVKTNSTYQMYGVSIIVRKRSDQEFQLPLDLIEEFPADISGESSKGGSSENEAVVAPRPVEYIAGRELLRELAVRIGRRLKILSR